MNNYFKKMKVFSAAVFIAAFFAACPFIAFSAPSDSAAQVKDSLQRTHPGEQPVSLDALDGPDSSAASPPAAPAGHPGAGTGEGRPFHLVLAVDATLELFRGEKEELSFSSNHQYVILEMTPSTKISFLMELTERVYWEFQYSFSPATRIKVGKLAIPFGPLFLHQVLGGVVEKPLPGGGARQLMVPEVWTEYGVEADRLWIDRYAYSLETRFVLSNGLTGDPRVADQTVDFTAGGGKEHDNNLDKAAALRVLQKFYGKYALNFSFYTSKWAPDRDTESFYEGDRIVIGGVDGELGYNTVPLPVLRGIRMRAQAALLRTRSTQRTAAQDNRVPWHSKSGTFVELTYNGLHRFCDLQLRYGDYDDNRNVLSGRDLVDYNIALIFQLARGVRLIPMYMINRERVNEQKDDFFFTKLFVEL